MSATSTARLIFSGVMMKLHIMYPEISTPLTLFYLLTDMKIACKPPEFRDKQKHAYPKSQSLGDYLNNPEFQCFRDEVILNTKVEFSTFVCLPEAEVLP